MGLLLFVWARLRDRRGYWGWALIGATVGLATLVRWQNLTFAAIPAADLLCGLTTKTPSNKFEGGAPAGAKLAACAAACALVFLPQLIGWRIVYGSFVTVPQGGAFMTWSRPNLLKLLFSTEHGLITWTPLCGVGLVGLFIWPKDQRRVMASLAVAMILQLYVGSCAGNVGWSFGMRRMVNCVPLFAVGFAVVITTFRVRNVWLALVVAGFALWNFLFALQYAGILDPLYVDRALIQLAEEQDVAVNALLQMDTLPDGEPFDLGQFVQEHWFPRDKSLTCRQFVTDKATVWLVVLDKMLFLPPR